MTKKNRMLEAYIKSLVETRRINKIIDTLPYGYISVKNISGRTYYYRQWRVGKKILSDYVPEAYYRVIEQKINIRKEYEKLLEIFESESKKYKKAIQSKKTDFTSIQNKINDILNSLDINEDEDKIVEKVLEQLD